MARSKKPIEKPKQAKQSNDTGTNLGFEAKLLAAADGLRNNMNAAKCKHVVLNLIISPSPALSTRNMPQVRS